MILTLLLYAIVIASASIDWNMILPSFRKGRGGSVTSCALENVLFLEWYSQSADCESLP